MSEAHNQLIRIGTRRSPLAMAQSQQVAQSIRGLGRGIEVELVPITTQGDRYFGPLQAAGGKGLFTAELEAALRCGEIDLAVHSAKDMPAVMTDEFAIAAVPTRADARDALITAAGFSLEELPPAAVVGTSSYRRANQLLAVRRDLKVVPLRGNVDTRLGKVLAERTLDAAVLAMAGLTRLELLDRHRAQIQPLTMEQCIPAAGQGTLAVQIHADHADLLALLSALDDADSRAALLAERAVVKGLHADCHSSLAVQVYRADGQWRGLAMASRKDGGDKVNVRRNAQNAAQLADELLGELLSLGADKLLRS